MTDIADIKKVELHCHVDGIITPSMVRSLESKGHDIDISAQELEKIIPVTSIDEWIDDYYDAVGPYVNNNARGLLLMLSEHIKNLKEQNVIYTEIMLTSFTHQHRDMDKQMKLYQLFRETADKLEDGQIQIEFLIAVGRTTDSKRFEKTALRVLEAKKRGYICGFGLAGLEDECTAKPYEDIFKEFKRAGLKIEIHAGEWEGPESVWDALRHGHADRIGHGLAVFKDRELLKHIIDNDIHIEMCPSSNTILTDITSIDKHPIAMALEKGMNFSINTDDPGPFGITMNSEFQLVADTFNLDDNDFEMIKNNSLRSCFAEELKYI